MEGHAKKEKRKEIRKKRTLDFLEEPRRSARDALVDAGIAEYRVLLRPTSTTLYDGYVKSIKHVDDCLATLWSLEQNRPTEPAK